jgi:hypothetical protein
MKIMCRRLGTAVLLMLINVGVMSTVSAQRQYRDSETNMRSLIRRIETRSETFSRALENAIARNRRNNTTREDEANRLVTDFKYATDQLKTRFENRQSTAADARTVLDRAASINSFVLNNSLEARVGQDWRLLQADLDLLARAYYINDWRWNAGNINTGSSVDTGTGTGVGNRLSDLQMRQLTRRINNRTATFSRSFRLALTRSNINGTAEKDEASRHLIALEEATNQLNNRVGSRQLTQTEARNVLEHAGYLNSVLTNYRFDANTGRDWTLLKEDLNQLASAYDIAWNWDTTPVQGGGNAYGEDAQLTGTYRLDTSRSTDPRTAAENATRNLPADQRQRVYDNLIARLEAPDTLAIERRGNSVTIASARAPQINFVVDGSEHVETNPNGRTARVRASFAGDQLIVSRMGDRAQDFTVTFDPIDNGRRLIVTRRLYSPQLNQPISVDSYYDKTADVAQLDVYSSSPNYSNTPNGSTASGDFVIPNGTQLVAVLNSNLSTETARDNERFTMTVRSPGQYDGATIEGYVTNVSRSGRVTGRSAMTLNFDTIRLRDGRSYRFAGIVEAVRTPGNDTVKVDNEGAVREDDQTNKTVQRAAIGTALGAIIGAIASGGKGAAIGAVLGAGAGAGSVYVQGRADLDLTTGTEVTIRASGPQ